MNSESHDPIAHDGGARNQGGHEVPMTPPPADMPAAAGVSVGAQEASAGGRSGAGARAGAIILAAFGGIALLGAGGTAAIAAVNDISASAASDGTENVKSVGVDGVTAIDVDVAASDVMIQFDDVDEATLEINGGDAHRWRLDRSGDELVLTNDDGGFRLFDGGWFGLDWFNMDERVVLTLPETLGDGRVDADFALGAGSLDVDGDFGEVGIDIGAGSFRMQGAATAAWVDVSAGRANVDLVGVTEADFTVSAGKLDVRLTDTTPDVVNVDVSAGSMELTVPDRAYDVTQDVSAGSLDNQLDTSSSARHKIDVSVSAGSAVLRPGD